METRVNFTEEDIKAYLDRLIKRWRGKLNDKAPIDIYTASDFENEAKKRRTAQCCVDIFQSVRFALFGEYLQIE